MYEKEIWDTQFYLFSPTKGASVSSICSNMYHWLGTVILVFSETVIIFQWVPQAWSTMRDQYRWEDNGVDSVSHERANPLHLWPCFWACVCYIAEEGLLSTLSPFWAVQDSSGQCPPAITEEEVRQEMNRTCLGTSLV